MITMLQSLFIKTSVFYLTVIVWDIFKWILMSTKRMSTI